jgi:hypothetical protein
MFIRSSYQSGSNSEVGNEYEFLSFCFIRSLSQLYDVRFRNEDRSFNNSGTKENYYIFADRSSVEDTYIYASEST